MLVTVVRYKGQAIVYASFEFAKQAIERHWPNDKIKWTCEPTFWLVEIGQSNMPTKEICIVHNTDILDTPTFPY